MKHDVVTAARGSPEGDLAKNASELRAKIHQIAKLVDDLDYTTPAATPATPSERRVLAILRARRNRSKFLPAALFADPAWDMLLELYAAELGQRRLSVNALCIGANVPPTTALRWMKLLEERGMITKTADPMDGRRIFVRLTPEIVEAMSALFAANPKCEHLL